MSATLNIPSHMGWKARAQAAADKKAARQDSHRERSKFSDALRELGRAVNGVVIAEDRVKALRADLDANQKRLDGYARWSLQSGRVHPQAMGTTFAIQQAAQIIEQAEVALVAARDRHIAALALHDKVMAEAAAAEPVPVEPEVPAATKKKGGRA